MKKSTYFFVIVTCLVCLTLFSSWGFLVHRTIHQLAVYELPEPMAPFFYANMEKLVAEAGRPDTRRNTDSTEASKHFIDLEPFGKNAAHDMPYSFTKAIKKYSKDSLLKYGYVPYHILYMKEKLTAAFRAKNKDSILFYATDLAHYIGDAHVPLHTTENYDGQLTDQKGLHSLWESVIPELLITEYNLYSAHKATYLKKPELAIWTAIRQAHALLPDVLAQEKAVSKQFTPETKYRTQVRRGVEVKYYTTAFAKAYAVALNNTVNEQLLASGDLIADFWYTSWIDAGKPDLSAITNWNDNLAKQYADEIHLYNRNELIKQKKLIAKKNNLLD
ncbi:MAG: hypothetical protein RL596_893 [Bacteroidota bacterium]